MTAPLLALALTVSGCTKAGTLEHFDNAEPGVELATTLSAVANRLDALPICGDLDEKAVLTGSFDVNFPNPGNVNDNNIQTDYLIYNIDGEECVVRTSYTMPHVVVAQFPTGSTVQTVEFDAIRKKIFGPDERVSHLSLEFASAEGGRFEQTVLAIDTDANGTVDAVSSTGDFEMDNYDVFPGTGEYGASLSAIINSYREELLKAITVLELESFMRGQFDNQGGFELDQNGPSFFQKL